MGQGSQARNGGGHSRGEGVCGVSCAKGPSPQIGSYLGMGAPWAQRVNKVYRAATTSLEFMSMVMVHPEVPRNSNGAGLGPRRYVRTSTGMILNPSFRVEAK